MIGLYVREARVAGRPGFDLLSLHPGAEVRNIEVKGRAGQSAIQWRRTNGSRHTTLSARHWLYVVFDCATPSPRRVRACDPFAKLPARSRESAACTISSKSLTTAAEQT